MGSNITLVVTSCDRHDFLKRTLDSFIGVGCGGAKPDRCIIVEDSQVPMPEWLRENIHFYSANLGKVEWIQNECRRGQVYSIDRAYALVQTDYIFHSEDDYEFVRGNFMIASKAILDRYPTISMVSLRGDKCNGHPNIDQPPYEGFRIQMPYWRKVWGGINYNVGLRRLSDYKKIGSYGKYAQYGTMGLETETPISELFLKMGYRIAVLQDEKGTYDPYVIHTGDKLSRMTDGYVVPLPKILIAIPVCHAYEYSKWESGDSPRFNAAIAYNGEPYGTDIHISEKSKDRLAALRDTWLKDVAGFKSHVDYKLFYGAPHDREPLADEVFLSCGDAYADLPAKTIEICKYAVAHGYDILFKADDDSLVYVDRVIHECLSGQWDYAGRLNGKVATGGSGYILTKRAFQIVAEKASSQSHWAEDVTVSKALFHNGVQGVFLPTHYSGLQNHWFWKDGVFDPSTLPVDAVTVHAVQPNVLRQWYAWKEGNR